MGFESGNGQSSSHGKYERVTNVRYVPGFAFTLLSIDQMWAEQRIDSVFRDAREPPRGQRRMRERLRMGAARPSRFACALEFSTLKSTRLLRPLAARRRAPD